MEIRKICKTGLILIVLVMMGTSPCFRAGNSIAWGKVIPDESGWFVDMKRFSRGAHTAFQCEECHGDMKSDGRPHPDSKSPDFLKTEAKRVYDYSRCKRCHPKAYARYQLGEHAKALESQKGKPKESVKKYAPTCGDCHSSHYDRSHLSRVTVGKKMTEICGECHIPQKITYLENYHGKAAVNLEYEKAAYCTDCHGAHTCVSLKNDPEKSSEDTREIARMVCRRCHPEAEKAFTEFVIHYGDEGIEEKDPEKKTYVSFIHIISALSLGFVIILLCAFYSHTFLLMLRKLHEKLRRHDDGNE